jgi:hypothetical protein
VYVLPPSLLNEVSTILERRHDLKEVVADDFLTSSGARRGNRITPAPLVPSFGETQTATLDPWPLTSVGEEAGEIGGGVVGVDFFRLVFTSRPGRGMVESPE